MKKAFQNFAHWCAYQCGQAHTFALAIITVVVWAICGPIFDYSDTWQLLINTGTTVVTFLMVFLVQNSQNRDTKAIHLKLDELIRATARARDSMQFLEDATEEELCDIKTELKRDATSSVETRPTST